jgi:predicted alpha/beta-fold hydrolase
MEDVRKKYSAPATILGHSLGAAITEYVGGKKDKVITVDKGVGLSGIGKTIGKNQTDIRTSNDPVSLLSNTQKNLGKKIVIKDKKNFNLLDAHNYKYLDKLKNKIL